MRTSVGIKTYKFINGDVYMEFKLKVLFTREKLNLLHREFIEEKESGFAFQVTNRWKMDKVSPINNSKHMNEFCRKQENIKFIEEINNLWKRL